MRRRPPPSPGSSPPARRLHGRPDYVQAVGAVDGGYKENEGWKVAQPSDHLRGAWWNPVSRSRAPRARGGGATANQDLKIAEAGARARAAVRFNRAGLFPTIHHAGTLRSVRESSNQPFLAPGSRPQLGGLSGRSISYEVDLLGRVRRTVASDPERAQAPRDLETARLSLQAELAIDYFELRAADAQQQLLDETVKASKPRCVSP